MAQHLRCDTDQNWVRTQNSSCHSHSTSALSHEKGAYLSGRGISGGGFVYGSLQYLIWGIVKRYSAQHSHFEASSEIFLMKFSLLPFVLFSIFSFSPTRKTNLLPRRLVFCRAYTSWWNFEQMLKNAINFPLKHLDTLSIVLFSFPSAATSPRDFIEELPFLALSENL